MIPTLSHSGNIWQHPATALLQTSKKGACTSPLQLFHFQVRCRRHWSNGRTRHALRCTLQSCGRSRHSKGSTISKAMLNCLALCSCQRAKIHDAKDLKTRTIWALMPWRATHCRGVFIWSKTATDFIFASQDAKCLFSSFSCHGRWKVGISFLHKAPNGPACFSAHQGLSSTPNRTWTPEPPEPPSPREPPGSSHATRIPAARLASSPHQPGTHLTSPLMPLTVFWSFKSTLNFPSNGWKMVSIRFPSSAAAVNALQLASGSHSQRFSEACRNCHLDLGAQSILLQILRLGHLAGSCTENITVQMEKCRVCQFLQALLLSLASDP